MSTVTDNKLKPSNSGELESEIKATVLRPLADKFQELTRQIDSGEYTLPKTIKGGESITENYINQAYVRLLALIEQRETDARIDENKSYRAMFSQHVAEEFVDSRQTRFSRDQTLLYLDTTEKRIKALSQPKDNKEKT